MKAELTLELYAIAVGVTGDSGVGSMEHNVEIVTETDHLYLPVHATILTAHEYDNRGKNTPQGGRNNGVKWVSNRPPAGQGIIRPRKNMAGKFTMDTFLACFLSLFFLGEHFLLFGDFILIKGFFSSCVYYV